jgi:hypothetical protein
MSVLEFKRHQGRVGVLTKKNVYSRKITNSSELEERLSLVPVHVTRLKSILALPTLWDTGKGIYTCIADSLSESQQNNLQRGYFSLSIGKKTHK